MLIEKYHILLVDDSIDDQELCIRALKKGGDAFVVEVAQTAEQCLEKIDIFHPHCILLDYQLPGMNGLQLLPLLKQKNSKTPVILLTNQGNESIAVQAIKEGAAEYITKSTITPETLPKLISRVIEHKVALNNVSQIQETSLLVIEDNVDDQELLSRMLKKSKTSRFFTKLLSHGNDLMRELREGTYDLALVDYSLPGENGIQLVKKIRLEAPFLPVIMMTNQGSEAIAVDAIRSGAFDYINKSKMTIETLETSIRGALKKNALERLLFQKEEKIKAQTQDLLENKRLLEKTVQGLQASNKMLEDFAQVVCHDLKAPLRHIKQYTHFLAHALQQKDYDSTTCFIETIQQRADKLETLIDDLIILSRFSAPGIEMVECDLNEVASDVCERLEGMLLDRNVAFSTQHLPTVIGNRVLFTHLLQNLVSNACKYNEADIPSVALLYDNDQSHHHISVKDNGIGFDEKNRDVIFQPFKRIATDKPYEGTGIGLAICKTVVEKHKGTITATSKKGVGTKFTISLPKQQRAPHAL